MLHRLIESAAGSRPKLMTALPPVADVPMSPIAVPVRRLKLIGGLFFLCAWGVLGVYLMSLAPHQTMGKAVWFYVVGGVSVCAASVSVYFFCRILFSNRPALLVNQNGIEENVSPLRFGKIPWNHITGIYLWTWDLNKSLGFFGIPEYLGGLRSQALIVQVRDIAHFMRRRSAVSRLLLRYNQWSFGSPIIISSGLLKANLDELTSSLSEWSNRMSESHSPRHHKA